MMFQPMLLRLTCPALKPARPGLRSWLWGVTLSLALSGLALAQSNPLPPASAPPVVATSAPRLVLPTDTAAGPLNPYGLRAVLDQGDMVAQLTLLILGLMSLLSWYIIVAKWLEQRRTTAQVAAARKLLGGAESLAKRTDAVAKDSALRALVDSALDAARRHHHLSGQVDMNTWLTQDIVRSVGNLQFRIQSGLSALATIGATAPFVGLFGTVWGIYNALVTIGVSGQASIDKVAGPVGQALIMTAIGLAVAVPAVLGYNGLVRRSRQSINAIQGLGSELHTQLLIELEKTQRAATATADSAASASSRT